MEDIIKKGAGTEEILRMSLEILMKAERNVHNQANGDLSNGCRFRLGAVLLVPFSNISQIVDLFQ